MIAYSKRKLDIFDALIPKLLSFPQHVQMHAYRQWNGMLQRLDGRFAEVKCNVGIQHQITILIKQFGAVNQKPMVFTDNRGGCHQ